MTEPKAQTQEVYEREALYMQSLSRHSEDFDKLLASVPLFFKEDRIKFFSRDSKHIKN